MQSLDPPIERVILVGVLSYGDEEWRVRDTLDELAQLAESAGAVVVERILVRQNKLKAGHYIGTGKAEEIADKVAEEKVTMVVFDDDLTPVQGRNLERIFKVRVLDRTQLILDIFAMRGANPRRLFAGGISTTSIFTSTITAHVDAFRATKRGYWTTRAR